ncbi:MAG TPA: hypothetical protein VFE65_04265 [Pseudonocardia sp.]|jgi:CO/xanthine dehydrogenase Mo-binding subunit|nr:hypothetical protein [Pseudonocardia sp.]
MTTTERPPPPTTTEIGRARARKEDARLITGSSRHTDVITPDMNALARLLPALGSTVHFAGEGVAVVVARDAATARDGADLVEVDYEPLQAVLDREAEIADGALRHLGVTDLPMPATAQRVRCAPRTASTATHQTPNNAQGEAQ